MNIKKKLLKTFFILSAVCLSNSTYAADNKNQLPNPKIQMGIAKITGYISGYLPREGVEPPVIDLFIPIFLPDRFVVDTRLYQARLQEDGSFIFDVPVQLSPTLGFLNSRSGVLGKPVGIALLPNRKTVVKIWQDKSGSIKTKITPALSLTDYDTHHMRDTDMLIKFSSPRQDTLERHINTADEFVLYSISDMKKRLEYAIQGMEFSEMAKNYAVTHLKLWYLKGRLLSFTGLFKGEFTKSYYSFLKQFPLNNPQSLYTEMYSETLQKILSIEQLDIPPIGDTPIKDWLKIVKDRIADLVGFDSGLFYDLLATHSYNVQLNSLKPLSDKQKENIQAYFAKSENKDIAPILLMKNEEVIKFNEAVKPLVVHQTPEVPKEKLMDAIIAKYKGKTVVVDFWATWCGPCLEGINDSKELKIQMKDKDVVFVYITNVSSPKALWEKTIPNIGGEHYYLTREQWNYILDSFGVGSIPMYLFYDADGAFKGKQVGYPGNSKMEEIINRLLH